ncbi:tyrosine-type recombinase/integrase [Methylosarcina fibrata]|uniref:tyrosine-type recombinase/integrase n=1 Tax=Methylosarcina fibrata TaxID=105972 RepID=UPI00037ED73C|nr:tyrosine-type recombinase/integrase [Methylosarcina fibrata]
METHFSFTKPLLENLPALAPGERVIYHDTHKNAAGLQLRATTTAKTFFVQKRVNGAPQRVTLGRFPDMTIEQARKQAAVAAASIANGANPRAEKKRRKLESKTLREVMADYLEARKNLKPLTKADIEKSLNEVCPEWMDKPLTRITPDAVKKRHQDHGEQRSQARANLAMRYLRALFNFAAAEYQDDSGKPLIDINPVKKLSQIKAWYRVDRRQTVIKSHELGAWVNAVLDLPGPDIRDYFLTVLLTGMRRTEALELMWRDVDMTAQTFTVRDPKNRQDHTLPMSDYLLELFARRKAAAASDFVFADAKGRRISNFRRAQAAVTKATGISFCIHDLRRTFATVAESLDIPAYALKRLLNHANGADVTAGYIVANVERLRDPMQKITDYVLKAAGVKETAEVIPLRKMG